MLSPAITIFPNEAMIDEEVKITLSGFESFQLITVRAIAEGMLGGEFEAESYAVFQADGSGNISVANQAPLSGTYNTKDPMGLFWSMDVKKLKFPAKRTLSALPVFPSFGTVTVMAEVDGHVLAETMLTRKYLSEDITYTDVLDDGIVGRLFYHPHRTRPGIIVLGGSEGGIASSSQFAALFASHGYSALALAYFDFEDLPDGIRNLPLEYVERTIQWMKQNEYVRDGQVALFGRSKGAELSLVIGATGTNIHAIVASSPTSVVSIGAWNAANGSQIYQPQSSWSYHGVPLPYLQWTEEQCRSAMAYIENNERFDHIHFAGMADEQMAENSTIRLEHAACPLMLISSDDDHYWPSQYHCERIVSRLKAFHYPYKVEHLTYAKTGHGIRFPYIPTTRLQLNGGTAQQNAYASADSWKHILSFLREIFAVE
ncbi:acyl-CoA thioesterase [Brevibacillus fluminis]|uniref:Acyl-CoA thioesterase n=2 Tax=Brevibacillus fluminis TaxID=511487 RepID=A0A3M8D9A2_9BACL|nr:acyl-CoA thioesterase [Brevibacillus fluminis]